MRILMIKTDPPYPLESGTDWVSYHLLRTLAREHEITYATLRRSAADDAAIAELRRYCREVIAVQQPNLASVFHRGFYKIAYASRSVLTGTPMTVWYNTPTALRKRVDALLEGEPFDLVHVEYWYAAPLAARARSERKILLIHDVSYLAEDRWLRHRRGLGTWWPKVQTAWVRRAELRMVQGFDTLLTLTDNDRDAVVRDLGERVRVRSLPPLYLPFPQPERREETPPRVLFLGHLRRRLVQDAVTYFCEEIWPRVRAAVPEAVFEVIGGGEERVRHLARHPGVRLAGFVRDVTPRIATAAVMVVPLRGGTGIKVKLIEGLCAGLPIVTTSVGAEGTGVTHGENVLVADTAEDFARSTVDLLEDPERRSALGRAAARFARERYASEATQRALLEFYAGLAPASA